MKISFVFELPYLLRLPQGRMIKISFDGTDFQLGCKNSESIKLLPWMEIGKSEIESLVFEHPVEQFALDSSTLRSTVTIETEVTTLDRFPDVGASILVWQQARRQDIGRGKLLYLLVSATKAYNKFIRAYSVTLQEAVNFTYLEPMYENQYPYGVRTYVDGEFIGWILPINRISMISLDDLDSDDVEGVCLDSLRIDPIREVFFHCQVLFMKREFELSLILCQQFLESIIDRYLSASTKRFHVTDEGTSFEFSDGKPQPVNVMRKYHDVIFDIEGRSLFLENDKWWDDLDIIVGLRNSLLHGLKSTYIESKRHYNLRFADEPRVPFKNPHAPKVLRGVRLDNDFPRLLESAARIASWLERGSRYIPESLRRGASLFSRPRL
jgi:hypothetical protein